MGTTAHTSPLRALSTFELIERYAEILDEFRDRGLLRTGSSLGSELAEHLVAVAYSGTRAPQRNQRGWDIEVLAEQRLQVKHRMLTGTHPNRAIDFSNWDFHRCIVIAFNPDYSIQRALEYDVEELRPLAKRTSRDKDRVILEGLPPEKATDVTEKLREALRAL